MTRRLGGLRLLGNGILYASLAVVTLVTLFPLLYAISASLMTTQEVSAYPPVLLPAHPALGNFGDVLRAVPLLREYFNSILVSTLVTVGQLGTATLAAYAFAFLRFPLRNVTFGVFVATMMVPAEAVLIPNYLFFADRGLINSYQALVLPFLAAGFGTFLLRTFFMTFPRELWEAALMDGCGHLRFLWSILVPLSRPALATLGIYVFLSTWNQYFWPLLVTRTDDMTTVQIGISRLRDVEAAQGPNLVLAGTVLVLIPTLVLIYAGQRHIVRGLTSGAIRG